MLKAQHPETTVVNNSQLLAQVLAHMLDRVNQPDGLASDHTANGCGLQDRLNQARMHGVGYLVNNASKKLREARLLMDAAPCEEKILDAVMDALMGIYFLNLLTGREDRAPATGTVLSEPVNPPAIWSNQNYYRFMEEVVTLYGGASAPGEAPPSDAASYQAPPDRKLDQPPPVQQAIASTLEQPGMPAASTAHSPTELPDRPYNRMARLRQAAKQHPISAASQPASSLSDLPATEPVCTPAPLSPNQQAIGSSASAHPMPSPNDRKAHYRREAESQAWSDYMEQAGKAIYATTVVTETGLVTLPRSMLFTVLTGAAPEAICNWQGNRLQPVWQVRPVGALPASLKQQARLWIYGHEYDEEGRFFASSYFSPGLTADLAAPSHAASPHTAAPTPSPIAPRSTVEAQAVKEYEAHLGHVLEVQELCGFVEALGDEVIHCVPPARVRVVKTSPDLLLQWRNNELWSQWQVEAVMPHCGLSQASRLRISGPAWRANGERISYTSVQQPL